MASTTFNQAAFYVRCSHIHRKCRPLSETSEIYVKTRRTCNKYSGNVKQVGFLCAALFCIVSVTSAHVYVVHVLPFLLFVMLSRLKQQSDFPLVTCVPDLWLLIAHLLRASNFALTLTQDRDTVCVLSAIFKLNILYHR